MNPAYVAFLAITIYAIRHVEADPWNETIAKAYSDKIAKLLENYQKSRERSGNVKLQGKAKVYFLNDIEANRETPAALAEYTKTIFELMRSTYGGATQDVASIRNAVKSFCSNVNQHDDIPVEFCFGNIIIRGYLKLAIYFNDLGLTETELDEDCRRTLPK